MFEFMRTQIINNKGRSAWGRGVAQYALDIIDGIEERARYESVIPANSKQLLRMALKGAMDWTQYSEGGFALIYNRQIAQRLCTPSELKKTQDGTKDPNPRESWIDVQTRALYQAWLRVSTAYAAFEQITKGGC